MYYPVPPGAISLQDLYLDHLTSRTHGLEEQLALYDAQCSAQTQETRAIKEALSEATMELEVRSTQPPWS